MTVMEKITINNNSQMVEHGTMRDFLKANIARMAQNERVYNEFKYDFSFIQQRDDVYIIRAHEVPDFHPSPSSRSMFGKIAISDPNSDLLYDRRFVIEHESLHSLDDIVKKASVWVPFTFIIDEGMYHRIRYDEENVMCKTLDIEPDMDDGDFSKYYAGIIYATEEMIRQYCGDDMSNIESRIVDRLKRELEWYDVHAQSELYNVSKCRILKNEDKTVSFGKEKHIEKVFMTPDEFTAHTLSKYGFDFNGTSKYYNWEDDDEQP